MAYKVHLVIVQAIQEVLVQLSLLGQTLQYIMAWVQLMLFKIVMVQLVVILILMIVQIALVVQLA